MGIGEYKVTSDGALLESIGLGSCVGVCLWDRVNKVGGLAHVMLPNSQGRGDTGNPYRYADKAIPAMVEAMVKKGADVRAVTAKIFGGASLFEGVNINIGQQNVDSVREELRKLNIKIVAEEVGERHGRSVWFDTRNGSVVVGKVFGETREY